MPSLLLTAFSQIGAAKGFTVKIVIEGSSLHPIQIADERVRDFNIWPNPGEANGFIADWSKGVVERLPDGLRPFEVEFFETGPWGNDKLRRSYHTLYAYDSATNQGFVYVPEMSEALGKGNLRRYGGGREGHWFRARSQWDDLARPALAGALVR